MIPLLLSIVCATYLVLVFKYFERHGISNLHGITVNYVVCIVTGIVYTQQLPDISNYVQQDWFPVAIFLGICFFCIFNLMGYVARHSGVTVTSVSSKLSMVIPVIIAIGFYGQQLTLIKLIALLAAILAVILSSVRSEGGRHHLNWKDLVPAFVIFIFSGINDATVNYATLKLLAPDELDAFNISIFSFAAFSGIAVLSFRMIVHQKPILPFKSVVGGIALGIPNYFSLLFLMKALNLPQWDSSVIFPINNMGIVVLTAICGWLLFRERLSKINIAGLLIALGAIALLLFAS